MMIPHKNIIGLMGKMGAGKTTLAQQLCKQFDIAFFSVDEIRRSFTCPTNANFTEKWEAVRENVRGKLLTLIEETVRPAIIEWPRLIEDGLLDLVQGVLIADCDEAVCIERLKNGDLSQEEIKARLSMQMPTIEIIKILQDRNVPYALVDTSKDVTEHELQQAIAKLLGLDYTNDHPFCLFRIPLLGRRVIWEMTNTCNYGCRYCIFSSTSRHIEGELTTSEILQTIDQLNTNGYSHIKITGGEPFLRNDLIEILSHCRQTGMITDVSTNASQITHQVARSLADLTLEMIHISLDGPSKEVHESVRGKNTFEPTLDGLRNLIAEKAAPIRIGCVVHKNNQNLLREMVDFCCALGCQEIIFSLMEPVGRMRDRPALLADRSARDLQLEIDKLTFAYQGQIDVKGSFSDSTRKGCGSCPGGQKFLFIDNTGHVSPCTWVSERKPEFISQMTLKDHSLQDILASAEMNRFRRQTTALSHAGLHECPMRKLDNFSKAQAFDEIFEGKPDQYKSGTERFSTTCPFYVFTTENISGYINQFDCAKKDVLTVGSSGDHAINFKTAGAKSVRNFDINQLAPHLVELKVKLLQSLPRSSFLNFFTSFEHTVYLSCRDELSPMTRLFFDKAFAAYENDGIKLLSSALTRKQQGIGKIVKNNPYLCSEAAYHNAQHACENLEILWDETSAAEMARQENGLYDLIFLSNLTDYAHMMFSGDYLHTFRHDIVEPFFEKLRPGGKLMMGYVFDVVNINKSNERSLINDATARSQVFSNHKTALYREILLPSAWEEDNRDAILVWEKCL